MFIKKNIPSRSTLNASPTKTKKTLTKMRLDLTDQTLNMDFKKSGGNHGEKEEEEE